MMATLVGGAAKAAGGAKAAGAAAKWGSSIAKLLGLMNSADQVLTKVIEIERKAEKIEADAKEIIRLGKEIYHNLPGEKPEAAGEKSKQNANDVNEEDIITLNDGESDHQFLSIDSANAKASEQEQVPAKAKKLSANQEKLKAILPSSQTQAATLHLPKSVSFYGANEAKLAASKTQPGLVRSPSAPTLR